MFRRAILGILVYQLTTVASFQVPIVTVPSTPIQDPKASTLIIFQYADNQREGDELSSDSLDDIKVPSCVQSPVLKQVYPALLQHISEYGNPNIPLGNSDGKKCKALRRLAFQKKLTEEEIDLLTSLGFRFNSLEDVYDEADFDECLERLIAYEKEFKVDYQIPKKYKPDPELGAWVTMIRRIGRDRIEPSRREKLDDINFSWVSTRKCGSNFMTNYRPLKEKLVGCCELKDGVLTVVDPVGVADILSEEKVAKWLKAIKETDLKGNLSETRCEFMDQLPGFNWRELV